MHSITYLNLDRCRSVTPQALSSLITHSQNLRCLSLALTLTPSQLQTCFTQLATANCKAHLEELDLSNLPKTSIDSILKQLRVFAGQNLKVLRLNFCGISLENVQFVVDNFPSLVRLEVKGIEHNPATLIKNATVEHPHLTIVSQ